MDNFTSTKFMTSDEKSRILRAFTNFIKSGFEEKKFTKAVYDHLHLNCGFIAHYNKEGFYRSRFCGLENITETMNTLINGKHGGPDYVDINSAIARIAEIYYEHIMVEYRKIEKSNLEYERKIIEDKLSKLS